MGDIFKLYKTVSKTHKVAGRDVDKNSMGDFIYIES
nr:MAG TPA: hypothetical protein [Crassvirales sp.]